MDQAGSRSGLVGDALRRSELERVVKRFSASRASTSSGSCRSPAWFIPSAAVDAGTGVVVGGPKYAAYEVERGRPFDVVRAA
jgi:hypothetical protein